MCTCPVVISVSTATRLRGSCASIASRMESLIWSAILSGWPSVTDSDVKRRRDTRYSLGSVTVGWTPGGGRLVGCTLPACAGGVVGAAEHPAGRDVVDHEQVAALAGELRPGVGEDVGLVVPRLGGEADDQLTGGALGDQLGEDVGVAHQRHGL